MLFSSWQFIFVFLPVLTVVFFILPSTPHWPRKAWLLAGSLFFYAYWKIQYVPLLLFSIGFNYAIAAWLTRHREGLARRLICATGVGVNLLLLGYFKYANFFMQILGATSLIRPAPHFDIVLPLAISFFTFTQIGYLVDVYRNSAVHYGLFDYAVFVAFFPHLIAGPIVRHWEIIPQYAARELKFNLEDLKLGIALFLLGLYKKVLLADPLSAYVSRVYDRAAAGGAMTCFDAWLGTLAFALQIYFDFSGYSDMAIGLARLFSIKFPINFNSPYHAVSISEFWQRWHITLTRFFREYVYFPLGGNRCSPLCHTRNILLTMLLSGLWHGAGWTFVLWGGLHGIYLVIAHRWRRLTSASGWAGSGMYRLACSAVTFVAVLFAWVFFRAVNLVAAWSIIRHMVGGYGMTMPMRVLQMFGPKLMSIFQHLGVKAVDLDVAAGLPRYKWFLGSVILALLVAFLIPNTQQLLASYSPALEQTQNPTRRLRLRLGLSSGFVLGAILVVVVRGFFATAPSPFLYFNF